MSYSHSPQSMQEFDRQMPIEQLMRMAGSAVAEGLEQLRMQRGDAKCAVILVGKGNNGGDALVAAKLLQEAEWAVQLVLASPPQEFTPLPQKMWNELPEELRKRTRIGLQEGELQAPALRHAMILDGLLGTGFNGHAPRENVAGLIQAANASHLPILSIDLPSGLNGETGEAELCIQATATICLAAIKTGLLYGQGIHAAGRLLLAPLPGEALLATLPHGPEVFGEEDARKLLPRFAFDAHKFQRGMVTILGGSAQYGGAPFLAGTGALQAGAGLVQVLIPEHCEVFCSVPQALIVQRLPDQGLGYFNAHTLPVLQNALQRSNALGIGPGMTTNPAILPVLAELISLNKPMVLDADALNLLATCPTLLTQSHSANIVLTPHAGEYARLAKAYGLTPTSDRAQAAVALAKSTGSVVVLKGARTVVADSNGRCSYNLSGCAALATAGSGDVLTGVIAAFLANGLPPYDAARLGVWLHGSAGERATRPGASLGLLADELPQFIRLALAEMY